jgi:alpha-beta hydrolase superfamily lysophospholipase
MDVTNSTFTVADVPGTLWMPAGEPVALILMGHGGGLHKMTPAVVARARHYAGGYDVAVATIDAPGHGDRPRNAADRATVAELHEARAAGRSITSIVAEYNESLAERAVPEWRATLDALLALPQFKPDTPVGYTGMTMATHIGIPLAASEPRIGVAVFGGAVASVPLLDAARRTTIPIQYLLPWDDAELDRDTALAMFDAFGSKQKTLHAFPGSHREVPQYEVDDSARFLTRHLT